MVNPKIPAQGDNSKKTSVEDTIRTRLTMAFTPSVLLITNESEKHKGHFNRIFSNEESDSATWATWDPTTAETHFHVEIKSECFATMSRVEGHRAVMNLLKDLMPYPLHALRLTLSS